MGYGRRRILCQDRYSHRQSSLASLVEAGGEKDTAAAIAKALETNDTVGGVVECVARNVPKGLGEPSFFSVEAALGQIAFGIPAVNGVEFGAGFASSRSYGSLHNDPFVDARGQDLHQ
ncbi:MAG: chorismate synthase [Marinilabiliales bacterium]|nr:chorismate synthase [Marinilabiliales bacterium]